MLLALCFSGTIRFLPQAVPVAVLGTILLLAGAQLAFSNTPRTADWRRLLPVALTGGAAAWNVAFGFIDGFAIHWAVAKQK